MKAITIKKIAILFAVLIRMMIFMFTLMLLLVAYIELIPYQLVILL